jgi:hypothetical protein
MGVSSSEKWIAFQNSRKLALREYYGQMRSVTFAKDGDPIKSAYLNNPDQCRMILGVEMYRETKKDVDKECEKLEREIEKWAAIPRVKRQNDRNSRIREIKVRTLKVFFGNIKGKQEIRRTNFR